MTFRYFEAPESEMSGLSKDELVCDLCGRTAKCFDLTRALEPAKLAPAARGCVRCLEEGRFGFFHVTEVGYLDEGGLTWYGDPPARRRRVFVAGDAGLAEQQAAAPVEPEVPAPDSVVQLRQTPSFPTWNEVSWPVHCADFMIFLGPWQPRDIRRAAQEHGEPPEAFFAGMTEPQDRGLWTAEPEWGLTFFVFRCTGCGRYRGIVDLD